MVSHNPLKICILSYRSNPHCGGQGVYVRNLSRALIGLGHQVDVLSGPPHPHLDEGIGFHTLEGLDLYNPTNPFRMPSFTELRHPINLVEWLGVSTMGFPEPFTFGLRAQRFLRQTPSQYDIIHDNQSLSYGVWAISKQTPTIATIHHPITVDRFIAVNSAHSFLQKAKQYRWYSFIGMQKRVARCLGHIITVSKRARQDISRDFKIPKDRFRIIPNGIDTHVFHPLPHIPREANRIITTTSADTPLKGLAYLLRAVANLAQNRDIKLVVVGRPKKNGRVESLVKRLGIGNRVAFTGPIGHNRFVRQYARATVAVVPSVYEGFGLPAGEAMACGIPVVSTSGGALPEVLGDAGALVPPADWEALARAIRKILDNPEWAAKLGRAGYRRVQTHFTWQRAAQQTVQVYREAIHDHRGF